MVSATHAEGQAQASGEARKEQTGRIGRFCWNSIRPTEGRAPQYTALMPSRQEVTDKLLARVNERIGRPRPCAVCGKTEWTIEPKVVNLSLSTTPHAVVLGGPQLPNVPLVCTHCGNTHLLNVLVLGFKAEDLHFDEPAK